MAQRQWRSDDTSKWKEGFGFGKWKTKLVTASQNFNVNNGSEFTGKDAPCWATINTTAGNYSATTVDKHGWYTTYADNGEPCIIYQAQGANVGDWELNLVKTFPTVTGSQTTVFKYPFTKSFVTSGSQVAIVIKVPQYKDFTIQSGATLTIPSWNGERFGVAGIFASGTATIEGSFSAIGSGYRGGTLQSTSGGWGGNGGEGCYGYSGRGGWTGSSRNGVSPGGGGQGNSDSWGTGAGAGQYYTGGCGGGGNDGNGGDEGGAGGGGGGNYWGGGGGGVGNDSTSSGSPAGDGGASTTFGGGNGGSGTRANGAASGSQASTYSGAGGNGQSGAGCNGGGGGGGANAPHVGTELTKIFMGGGGGAGGNYGISNQYGQTGSNGSGIIFIFAKNIVVSGSVTVNGVAGVTKGNRGGSGGAGAAGCILMKCENATLGTSKVLANGAAGGGAWYTAGGGNSSRGVIHVDYKNAVTGTTSPTLSTRQDATIKSASRGGAFLLSEFT